MKLTNGFMILIFIVLIPTVYFIMFSSYVTTLPRPTQHKLYEVKRQIKKEFKNRFQSTKAWNKIYSPHNIPDEEIVETISKNYPNIPLKYWFNVRKKQNSMHLSNSSCAPFPDIFSLNIHNTYWQVIHMSNRTTVQVYSAYYDKRKTTGKLVRILSMVNKTSFSFPGNTTYYCQLWFDNEDQPVIAPMDKLEYMWFDYWHSHSEGLFGPYLLGCSIPQSHYNKIPQVVSFVENPCDKATNMLRVVYVAPKKKEEFSVCVKGLDFLQIDLSFRLVEWIELVLHMGADKIYLYYLEAHPNMRKVLEYYIKMGKVDLRKVTLPSTHPNLPLLQHIYLIEHNLQQCLDEIIPYNDCFYRNINSHKYVAIFDIDEIILPLKDNNWHDLIERTKKYEETKVIYNGFTARHIYFLDKMQKEGPYEDIPPYMHMMQHVYRARDFTDPGAYVKTIFDTDHTISCHNHYPISVAPESISREFLLEDARMQHYRKECSWEVNCTVFTTNTVKDTRLWDFKNIIIPRVNKALMEIGLLQED